MSTPSTEPEQYRLSPSEHVPNSALPRNLWLHGGVFKAYRAHHFHSLTHECYAVFKGSSTLLLGRGPLDAADGGAEVDVRAGDLIVLPAGVSHCSLDSEGGYEYVGLYPQGSPHWDNNFCRAGELETAEKAENARKVPIPEYDPIYGRGGPLVRIWRAAAARAADEA